MSPLEPHSVDYAFDLPPAWSVLLTGIYVLIAAALCWSANARRRSLGDVVAFDPTTDIGSKTPGWRGRFTITDLLEIAGIVAIALAMIHDYSMLQRPPQASLRRCQQNLHRIAKALQNYEQAFGCYPPLFIAGPDGKPAHSWRVLLLPYFDDVEMQQIYDRYHFDEPWDGPSNQDVVNDGVFVYRCPSCEIGVNVTSYFGVLVPQDLLRRECSENGTDIDKAVKRTFAVVEKVQSWCKWAEPRDLDFTSATTLATSADQPGLYSCHGATGIGGAQIMLSNGQVVSTDRGNGNVLADLLRKPRATSEALGRLRTLRVASPAVGLMVIALVRCLQLAGKQRLEVALLVMALAVAAILISNRGAVLIPVIAAAALIAVRLVIWPAIFATLISSLILTAGIQLLFSTENPNTFFLGCVAASFLHEIYRYSRSPAGIPNFYGPLLWGTIAIAFSAGN